MQSEQHFRVRIRKKFLYCTVISVPYRDLYFPQRARITDNPVTEVCDGVTQCDFPQPAAPGKGKTSDALYPVRENYFFNCVIPVVFMRFYRFPVNDDNPGHMLIVFFCCCDSVSCLLRRLSQ